MGRELDVTRVNRAALAQQLVGAGLCDPDLASQVARLGGRFPAIAGRNIFFEYELRERPIPSGVGFGLPAGTLDFYCVTDHWFLSSPAGRDLGAAMADDPFAADHAEHLNLIGDADPDWIEYDIAEGQTSSTPFIFFRPPSRLHTLETTDQARQLCEILPAGSKSGDFARMLNVLVDLAPTTMYRVGIARQRGNSWWRAILTNLTEAQVSAALHDGGGAGFAQALRISSDLYAERADSPGACFALSVDVDGQQIQAMDVECPFLFRIADPASRRAGFEQLLMKLSGTGLLSPTMAQWLSSYCLLDVASDDHRRNLRVMVHHLKHRFMGPQRLRTKAYFHLEMTVVANDDVAS